MRTAANARQLRIVFLFVFLFPYLATAEEPKFVVVAPKSSTANADLGATLYRVLLGNGQRAKFEKAESIEEALASKADVIVLAMPSRKLPDIEKEAIESLKKRKIVGIGYGAAMLFGQLGLQINNGQCAHGTQPPPALTITKSDLLGAPKSDDDVLVMKETADLAPKFNEDGERILDLFGVFLPSSEAVTSSIDVIARWSSDANYAPITRQGNCVLIGIASPATQWSKSYCELVGETCMALHQRKLEEFSNIRHEVTKPGNYEFQLAPERSTDKPFVKKFYFQFAKPTKLHAKLEHSGSTAIMLCTEQDRQDAFKGEALMTVADITAETIEQIGDGYWEIDVTNFDSKSEAKCKLTITIEEE